LTALCSILCTALAQAGDDGQAAHVAEAIVRAAGTPQYRWAGWILWLPALSALLCGLCAALRIRNKAPAWITVALLGGSFAVTCALYAQFDPAQPIVIRLFDWFNLSWGSEPGQSFVANFALYVDSLTLLWMLFVTGLGTLIALYASEYMEPDVGKGYARFFGGVSIFLFAMASLVMGDNLVMLYLGWEGVGFASYMLIGYYYTRPSAVAAAKKAFIMNRIGDLGLALGIWLIWSNFGSVEYDTLFAAMQSHPHDHEPGGWSIQAIPFLLMLGAFGKSAQLPLYVWLPDAMEGPTPVSALIHAATMVTAGVYLIARMYPFFDLHPAALPTVAWVGGLTALLAATIGMAQYDIKRIMAYSTVSQLGYMFMGLGVATTFGAAYHVFTHAFFKAVLFLTCGAVMHGFAGQLDLRKLSGLMHLRGWRIVAYTMLAGCLCLAGFPFSSGFFSKDAIIAETFVTPGFAPLGWLALFTALLTAYYTFRVWFRVCAGPVSYEPGDEHHGDEPSHEEQGHGHAHATSTSHGHGHADRGHFHPHAPRLAINFVLVLITIGAIGAGFPFFFKHGGWIETMVGHSSAMDGMPSHEAHGSFLGFDPHVVMYYVSGGIALLGIAIAAYFHLFNRRAADSLRASLLANPIIRWIPTAMENKWYVDELYHTVVRAPLWLIGHVFAGIDRYLVDGLLVDGIARIPRVLGRAFQPLQNGVLQAYAMTMAGGMAIVLLFILHLDEFRSWVDWLRGGGG
jgi:NADH-quinone oxidoreductase subunit L